MIPRVLVNGLLQADWFEPIAVHVNGLPFTSEGSLAVAIDATVDHVHNGIPFDADGRVCVEEGSAAYHLAGRAYTASNRLLVDIFGTQANALAGLPLTSAGALAVEMFASATFALDFARDQYSTLSPALTVSGPTGGVMVPDYLGNYHKTLANEIPIKGGRRLYNLLANTDTLATQGVTVEDADYWLSFKGTGSVAVTGVATDSLAGTGADDRVSKKVTMGSAGTATFTVTGSVTEAYLYKSRPGQTTADFEYVSRGVLSSPYHGYGVDGLAWMRTDPSGLALADAASGYSVLCTGIADWPTLTNRLTYNQDASQWTKRGSATCTDADDGTVEGGYLELRSVGADPVNDVYRQSTGHTADEFFGACVAIRPVDTTGTLRLQNPSNSGRGRWDLDLSTLNPGVWNLVSRSHPGITVISEFQAFGVNGGMQFIGPSGLIDVDVAVPTLIGGTLYCPVVIPTDSLAVTADAIVYTLDKDEIGYVAGGGTWVIEHVPDLPASYNPNWQVVLDLWNDANNRAMFYNRAGNSGMYVVNGGAAQADGNDADAAWEVGVLQRVAVRFEADDIALVTDGEEHLTDTSATLPTVNTIYLGGKSDSAYQGSIGAIAYYAAGA